MRCSKIIGVLLLITNLRILILMSGLSASVIFIPSSYRRKKEKMLEESNLYNETEYLQIETPCNFSHIYVLLDPDLKVCPG